MDGERASRIPIGADARCPGSIAGWGTKMGKVEADIAVLNEKHRNLASDVSQAMEQLKELAEKTTVEFKQYATQFQWMKDNMKAQQENIRLLLRCLYVTVGLICLVVGKILLGMAFTADARTIIAALGG